MTTLLFVTVMYAFRNFGHYFHRIINSTSHLEPIIDDTLGGTTRGENDIDRICQSLATFGNEYNVFGGRTLNAVADLKEQLKNVHNDLQRKGSHIHDLLVAIEDRVKHANQDIRVSNHTFHNN